ncbi:MAG TPA: FAD/NAD(P)-binding oxidoreductase [Gaiellaceae bacterium]|nr:FAD/NAD(P)-binding oxidoreductase [Gaiellaceae bacterium]
MESGPSKVVIVGGGVAALEAALALEELASELVEVELVAPEQNFVYRPLLVAEPFGAGQVRTFPLHRLAEGAGAKFTEAIVTGVDSDRHVVRTAADDEIPFDLLLLATGAVPVAAVPGALCFRGPTEAAALRQLLDDASTGMIDGMTFAVPAGASWTLPLYELALLARSYLVDEGAVGVTVTIVTPEDAPLALFGSTASEAVRELLDTRGIEVALATTPLAFADGGLSVAPAGIIPTDRVVALPRLEGPRLAGVIHDANGFIPTDEHGQVADEIDVWAAGDATRFPLKQGGVAAQQADAAAESIAARAGASLEPRPFRPVLRGLLLTGMAPRFLRAEAGTATSAIDTEPLWWPPAKIVGRYLAPFLAKHLGLSKILPDAARASALPVEVELTATGHGDWSEV